MNPLVTVLMNFRVENLPSLIYFCDAVPNTGSYQMILNPSVRSFDLSLGGRTQGIDDLDVQIPQNFLPLNDGVPFFSVSLLPDGVSSFDKPEDRVVIHVVLQRTAKARHQCLCGHNMSP